MMKQNDFLDIIKFSLSLMVLGIHVGLNVSFKGFDLVYPWVRLAVPLFFIISGYIFFGRIKDLKDSRNDLAKFIIRVSKLYLFWFLLLLPIILYTRSKVWFGHGIVLGILYFLRSLFLGSTFTASWFLSALLLSTVVVYYVSKIFNTLTVLIVCSVPFAFCVAESSYGLCAGWGNGWYNSFLVALVWTAMGKYFAEKSEDDHLPKMRLVIGAAICLLLYWSEWYWRYNVTGSKKFDCYGMLLPVCFIIFDLILRIRCHFRYAKQLRSLSVVIFCLHGSVAGFVPFRSFDSSQTLRTLIVLICCIGVYVALCRISKIKGLGWIRCSY